MNGVKLGERRKEYREIERLEPIGSHCFDDGSDIMVALLSLYCLGIACSISLWNL